MDADQVEEIMGQIASYWPKLGWNKVQADAWRAAIARHSYHDVNRAILSVYSTGKIPKIYDVTSRVSDYCQSRTTRTDTGEKIPETWVQQLRRMHNIPAEAPDWEVLMWRHSLEAKSGREAYGASWQSAQRIYRDNFRREWEAAGLDEVERAEQEIFG